MHLVSSRLEIDLHQLVVSVLYGHNFALNIQWCTMKFEQLRLNWVTDVSEYNVQQHQFSNRQNKFSVSKTNNLKVGENILINRLSLINNRIPLEWLNLGYNCYKIKCKQKLLA